jgi:two-component system, chemotaxis family, chemotaxis protein CheY
MTILLVDDNPAFRAFVHRFIKRSINPRAEVRECADGSAAVEMYRLGRPDWVLMDIAMQTMDGLTAAKHIRTSDPHARIVILTQHSEQAYRDAAENIGVAGFVLKEHIEELRALLA